jgi:adenylate cyclase class 2
MLEIEVKLRIGKPADVESRLRALGAYPESARQLQDDILFDYPDRRITDAGSLMRLRRLGEEGCLTFKSKVESSMQAKVRKELEVKISDALGARAILEALGLGPVWRYQKYRTGYRLGALHAVVDEAPIGNFLELEGPKLEIDRWAGALGFSKKDYVLETYRDLYEQWCREQKVPVGDMVFPDQELP